MANDKERGRGVIITLTTRSAEKDGSRYFEASLFGSS